MDNISKKDSKCSKCSTRIHQIIYTFFLEHPVSVNMTYLEHFQRAISLCFQTGIASCALLIHSIIPKFFPHTGTSIIKKLNNQITDFERTHKNKEEKEEK